ncbi:MAG: TadE/TadG family type IV pilus assembly protein [Microthrixaceae bacterium]
MLVEFALILPVMMALLLGIFTGGIALNLKTSLTGAAREGSRYGATVPETQCTPISQCSNLTWAQLVRAQTVANSAGTLTSDQVCVSLVSGSGSAPVAGDSTKTTSGSACFVDNSADTGKRVQVKVTRPAEFNVVFYSQTISLSSTAVSRYEQ